MSLKEWNNMSLEEQNEHWGLPEGVRWSKEFPTENGWYFAKFPHNLIYYGIVHDVTEDSLDFWGKRLDCWTCYRNESNDVEWCHIKSVNGN